MRMEEHIEDGLNMDPIGITIMIMASLIKVGFIIMLNGII